MKKLLAMMGIGVSAAFLAACGTTQVDDAGTESAASGGPVSVTDGQGKTVELDAAAQKVVTLEWDVTEMAAAVGVEPVGVADVEGFEDWNSAVKLSDDVTDVGLRQEPSLEAIGRLSPDLIIGVEGSVPENAMADMEKIAPVLILKGADAADPIGLMKTNNDTIAKAVGRDDEGQNVWGEYEAAVADAKETVADGDAAGTPLALVYAAVEGNNATFRMHGPGSLPIAIATEAGLEPAWKDKGDAAFGLSSTDVEGLTKLPDDTQLLWWQNTPTEKSPIDALEKNKVWKDLGFVKAGKVQPAANRIWIYGGPKSGAQWATQVADLVTK